MRRSLLSALVVLSLPLAAGTLQKIGDLQIPRSGHTATLLPDGRVLIAGAQQQSLELVEVFNGVATSTLTQAQSERPLAGQTATLVPSGSVLLIGGSSDLHEQGDDEVTAYRPDALTVIARLNDRRDRHQSTLLADGRVLVTGGEMQNPGEETRVLDSAELVAADGSVRRTSAMLKQRTSHQAVRLLDGRVLITGGNRNGNPTAEVFDPATEAFSYVGPPQRRREFHTMTLLQDGRVLVAGGGLNVEDPAEIFDPATNQFTTTTFNYPVDMHAAVLLHDGTVLLAGDREVVVYDPRRDAVVDRVAFGPNPFYTEDNPFDVDSIELRGIAATLLPDGSVLLTGGEQLAHWPYPVTDIWLYKSRATPKRRAVR